MPRASRLLVLPVLFAALAGPQALAADKLRVGTPEAVGFNFHILDAGVELGNFAKYDLDIQRIDLEGGAKLHQAMAAGELDIALGGGTDLTFLVKGSPEKAVAVLGTAPSNLAVLVPTDSPITAIADLKDKKIAATTVGSLTSWFALEIAHREGWGPNGITLVYIGGTDSMLAGLATKAVDAAVGSLEIGHIRAPEGKLRILLKAGEFVPDFVASVIYASDALIAQRPDALRRFLEGWFETVAYMHNHRPETIAMMAKIMAAPPDAIAKIYDDEMASFPTDGHFDPHGLALVEQALVDFGRIERIPDNSRFVTEAFLP